MAPISASTGAAEGVQNSKRNVQRKNAVRVVASQSVRDFGSRTQIARICNPPQLAGSKATSGAFLKFSRPDWFLGYLAVNQIP